MIHNGKIRDESPIEFVCRLVVVLVAGG